MYDRNALNIRKKFRSPFGEIIDYCLEDRRITQLYSNKNKRPAHFKNQPVGSVAVKLDVISENTKTALLSVQAAERALHLVEKTEAILKVNDKSIDFHKFFLNPNDPVFQYVNVGSESSFLCTVQQEWLNAQIMFNETMLDRTKGRKTKAILKYTKDVKIKARDYYREAATLLEKEQHVVAAFKVKSVLQSVFWLGENSLLQKQMQLIYSTVNEQDYVSHKKIRRYYINNCDFWWVSPKRSEKGKTVIFNKALEKSQIQEEKEFFTNPNQLKKN